MYFRFIGPAGEERVKIPEEIARKMPKKMTAIERNDYISDLIYSDTYYRKVIPQAVAKFLSYFYVNRSTPGGYPVYDEMEIGNLTVCVVGSTGENEANTQMFAYRKGQKTGQ
ncbi:MAG: hypothetical protein ABIK26_03645 [Candidatus Omnitrophota bacterium]